jgi:uncharacterized protein YbjT (DUF2867 family)
MKRKLTVLVSGATGKQGGALVKYLLRHEHDVHALTRDPASIASKELEMRGVTIKWGDFDEPESVVRAATGMDAFFIMGTPYEKGPEAEIKQGIAAVDAAQKAGVGHVVYTSVGGADRDSGIPHFESKFKVELHLRSLKIPHTILAPVYFFENIFSPISIENLKKGIFTLPMPPDRKLQMIAADSIGSFAAFVIENRKDFLGKRVEIASDELSGREIAEIVGKAIGKPVSFVSQSIDSVRKMSDDMARMYEWFDKFGYMSNIEDLRKKYKEVTWLKFDEWVRYRDWEPVKI